MQLTTTERTSNMTDKESKYPAPRPQQELNEWTKHLSSMKKAELLDALRDYRVQFRNLAADHCIAGTKLDRALVDLKEARQRIKTLEAKP